MVSATSPLATKPGELRTNLVLACGSAAALLFMLAITGRIEAMGGLGWDGADYADMVSGSLLDGTPNTQLRPLVALLVRPVYRLIGTMTTAFEVMNVLFAGVLGFVLCLLFDTYGGSRSAKIFFIANVALCVATVKMFAYYPVLVDLGACAILTTAIYLIATNRRVAGSVAATLAVLAREFGIIAVLFGVHRDLRCHRSVGRTALTYLPAAAAFVLLRVWVRSSAEDPEDIISISQLFEHRVLWHDPLYAGLFTYFVVTIFGGVSLLLFARAGACLRYLRQEHEWLLSSAVLVGVAALGSADIWRYLVYLLPLAAMLFARCSRDGVFRPVPWTFGLAAGVTWFTQRPLQVMTPGSYFQDWFPYYVVIGEVPSEAGQVAIWPSWGWRFLAAALFLWILTAVRPGASTAPASP